MISFPHASFRNRSSRMGLLIGLALMLVACGGKDNQQENASEETATTSADTLAVTMTDFAFEPASLTVPAGQKVTLTFTNSGSVEHYFVVGDTLANSKDGFEQNLFSGVSIEKNKQTGHQQTEGHHREEEHEEEEGHHENEFELPPGGRGSITFTLPPSKTGTYTVGCFVSTDNKTHYEMGMKGTLTVTAPE